MFHLDGWLVHRGSREEAEDEGGKELREMLIDVIMHIFEVSGSNESRARNDENRDETEGFDIELGADGAPVVDTMLS